MKTLFLLMVLSLVAVAQKTEPSEIPEQAELDKYEIVLADPGGHETYAILTSASGDIQVAPLLESVSPPNGYRIITYGDYRKLLKEMTKKVEELSAANAQLQHENGRLKFSLLESQRARQYLEAQLKAAKDDSH